MPLRVHVLDVEEQEVRMGEHPFQGCQRRMPACVQGGVVALLLQRVEQAQREVRLSEGLPPGECHATSRPLDHGPIPVDGLEDIPDVDLPTDHLQGVRVAFLDARAA